MATKTRVYIVCPRPADGAAPQLADRRLVRAAHPAAALRHVTDGAYCVWVPDQEQLIETMTAGIKPEDAHLVQDELAFQP